MPGADDRAVRARSVWSGTISFGLVSIPVSLFPAHRPSRVSLRMLDDDGTPLARRYYDPGTGEDVSREEIVRGYEIEPDRYVVITEAELEAIEPDKTRDIDLQRFVPADQLDPVYFERAYYLAPDGSSTRAYRLLAAVMERSGRAGIATFVMRTKEYLIAILAENGILRAETLRFHDEIRPVDAIDQPERPEVDTDRVDSMAAAIRERAEGELDESELEDAYADRLRALVEAKRKEGVGVVTSVAAPEEGDTGDIIDLMEVLKRSLQGGGAGARRPRSAADGSDGSGGEDLSTLTKAELYERAQELDISGRSSMNKGQLVEAIRRSA